jgi:hypothetical protein
MHGPLPSAAIITIRSMPGVHPVSTRDVVAARLVQQHGDECERRRSSTSFDDAS